MFTLVRFALCATCVASRFSAAYGQPARASSARWDETTPSFYLGVEGVVFVNRPTGFTQPAAFLSAADRDLAPRPAFLAGYRLSPRFAIEARLQDLPVMTGYTYQQKTASAYLGFGESYVQDYLYVPVHGVVQLLGAGHRLGLSVLAGGGPAWTDTKNNAISPNGTQVFTASPNGTVGVGPGPAPGTATTATVTQQITREHATIAAFEAGARGAWRVLPRLRLDLTVRQLWSTVRSARDVSLDIRTNSDHLTTTMTTPVRGLCLGVAVAYQL